MSKVRINDLARELEVKSRPILDALIAVGVTETKTHSSSIEADEAEKVRNYFKNRRGGSAVAKPAADAKPAFNLSHVSKPGDALKAILERKQAEALERSTPPRRAAVAAPVAAPVPQATAPVAATPAAPAPRRVVPQPRQQSAVVAPAPPPAIASKPPVGPVVGRPPVVVVAPAGSQAAASHAVPAHSHAVPAQSHAVPGQSHAVAERAQSATPAAVKHVPTPVAAATPAAIVAGAPAALRDAPSVDTSEAEPKIDGVGAETTAIAVAAAHTLVPAVRRVVMPQTGPRS